MRYSTLFSPLAVAVLLGGCAGIPEGTTRSVADPLSFAQDGDVARIEGQAMILNQLGDQLVLRSTLPLAPVGTGTLLSAGDLERDIVAMSAQMQSLEGALAGQGDALADLRVRRRAGDVSRRDYLRRVEAITQSRARIVAALALTEAQVERAHVNMLAASRLGQDGLDPHLAAATDLASNVQATRTTITPVKASKPRSLTLVTPRSGVLR